MGLFERVGVSSQTRRPLYLNEFLAMSRFYLGRTKGLLFLRLQRGWEILKRFVILAEVVVLFTLHIMVISFFLYWIDSSSHLELSSAS